MMQRWTVKFYTVFLHDYLSICKKSMVSTLTLIPRYMEPNYPDRNIDSDLDREIF